MYKYIMFAILAISLVSGIYYKGYSDGSTHVQNKWNSYTQQVNKMMSNLKDKYNEQKEKYTEEETKLVLSLQEKETQYKLNLATLNASFNNRLQQSNSRANIYQRMSADSESQRKALADYTAQLDRQLTEGIDLVRELREVIKLRDEQLRTINTQFQLMEKASHE